jgi:hypothetical protein
MAEEQYLAVGLRQARHGCAHPLGQFLTAETLAWARARCQKLTGELGCRILREGYLPFEGSADAADVIPAEVQ